MGLIFLDKFDLFLIHVWICICYFIFETLLHRTPAKLLTSTKVVNLDGSKSEVLAIIKRTLLRLVPFDAFSESDGS